MLSKEQLEKRIAEIRKIASEMKWSSVEHSQVALNDAEVLEELLSLREQLAELKALQPVAEFRKPSKKHDPMVFWFGKQVFPVGTQLFTAAKPAALQASDANNKVDITCYSCRRFITFQQHAEADGFCPYCGVEIELTPSTLAVPNVKTIEDNLIEQVGLMCDQATNIEEKNVYGHAYCVLKYGILPYLRKQGK